MCKLQTDGQRYLLQIANLVTKLISLPTLPCPRFSAAGSVVLTGMVQGWAVEELVRILQGEKLAETSPDVRNLMIITAIAIFSNWKQYEKLQNVAQELNDFLQQKDTHYLVGKKACPSMVLKICNTLINLLANGASAFITMLSFEEENFTYKMIACAVGALSLMIQVPATLQYFNLLVTTELWAKIHAVLYAIPNGLLYSRILLRTPYEFYASLFATVSSFIIYGIAKQYFGIAQKEKVALPCTNLYFPRNESDNAPLLAADGPQQQGYFLERIGLSHAKAQVCVQAATAILKSVGVHLTMEKFIVVLGNYLLQQCSEEVSKEQQEQLELASKIIAPTLAYLLYGPVQFVRGLAGMPRLPLALP